MTRMPDITVEKGAPLTCAAEFDIQPFRCEICHVDFSLR